MATTFYCIGKDAWGQVLFRLHVADPTLADQMPEQQAVHVGPTNMVVEFHFLKFPVSREIYEKEIHVSRFPGNMKGPIQLKEQGRFIQTFESLAFFEDLSLLVLGKPAQ